MSLLIAVAGCSGMTAEQEPTGSDERALSSASADASEASDDAYACKVVETEQYGELTPFISAPSGTPAYAGVCSGPEEGALASCWSTGPRHCDGPNEICGGFSGSQDPATGEFRLSGGQHMLCEYPCVSDDQCPAPSSGTARATCMRSPEFNPATDGGSCMLGCGSGETCPDGFVCIEPGLSFGQSDGSDWPAPAQCVQFKTLTL